jgi:hypothetical protein
MTNEFRCVTTPSSMSTRKFMCIFTLHPNVWLFTGTGMSPGFYKPRINFIVDTGDGVIILRNAVVIIFLRQTAVKNVVGI